MLNGFDCIVTRNIRDYERSPVEVLTVEEWLRRWSLSVSEEHSD